MQMTGVAEDDHDSLRRGAIRAVRGTVTVGRDAYVRDRHLPRIIAVGPDEIADRSERGRALILSRLERALRAERNRGRAGHWSYDLNRHIALHQAHAAESRPGAKEKAPPLAERRL